MKTCTRCHEEKGLTEFHRNKRRADGHSSWCRECTSAYHADYHKQNAARQVAKVASWRKENPEARKVEYQKAATAVKARAKAWQLANPAKRRMFWANYRAKQIKATPTWADARLMHVMYANATNLNADGRWGKFHVDHIVPLNSPLVCGLHTHSNLRVVHATVNMAKSNKTWPDMP